MRLSSLLLPRVDWFSAISLPCEMAARLSICTPSLTLHLCWFAQFSASCTNTSPLPSLSRPPLRFALLSPPSIGTGGTVIRSGVEGQKGDGVRSVCRSFCSVLIVVLPLLGFISCGSLLSFPSSLLSYVSAVVCVVVRLSAPPPTTTTSFFSVSRSWERQIYLCSATCVVFNLFNYFVCAFSKVYDGNMVRIVTRECCLCGNVQTIFFYSSITSVLESR